MALRWLIEPIEEDYDFILIDLPPTVADHTM
jgi:cellulose biosynthesis protein BcsQ